MSTVEYQYRLSVLIGGTIVYGNGNSFAECRANMPKEGRSKRGEQWVYSDNASGRLIVKGRGPAPRKLGGEQ